MSCLALAEIRERDWCNVVTCHMDTPRAYVWRLQNFVIGEHVLKPCPDNPTPVKVLLLSPCSLFFWPSAPFLMLWIQFSKFFVCPCIIPSVMCHQCMW